MTGGIDWGPPAAYPQDMAQDQWTGIIAQRDAALGWQFDGRQVVRTLTGRTEDDIMQSCDDRLALIVADGKMAAAVPAAVLPQDRPFGDLTQPQPRGLLPASGRICLAGALASRPDWDGVICLQMPDATHWCQISAAEIVSFQSAVTPFLAKAFGAQVEAAQDGAFSEAASDTMSRPERLAVHLRSAQLAGNAAAVAGHLLGAELAAMRAYWLGQRMIVIGPDSRYADLLGQQGVQVDVLSVADCMRDGLIALRHSAMQP